MLKVTMFNPVQFGGQAVSASAEPARKPSPTALLRALEQDMFTRQTPPPPVASGSRENTIARLEAQFGERQPATLMVLDELQHLLKRLKLDENRQVKLSVVETPGANGREHVMLEAAHEGVYSSLIKGLQEMGVTRPATERNAPENRLSYAGVPVLLFERGLESAQLPADILRLKTLRESLGQGGNIHLAAKALNERLDEHGLKDLQVHPLNFEQPGQLWVLYPSQDGQTRNPALEEDIRGKVNALPESETIEGKPGFRQGKDLYPVAIAPGMTPKAPLLSPEQRASVKALLQDKWQQLLAFLRKLFAQFGATPTAG